MCLANFLPRIRLQKTPPSEPGPRGGAGGGCGERSRAAARPFRRRPRPARAPSPPLRRLRPRCHAASARPGPGPSPAFHRAPPPARSGVGPGPPAPCRPPSAGIRLDATRRRPAPCRGRHPRSARAAPACPFRAGRRPARAPRPLPARAAAGRPWPSVRGLHRAASVRPVRLIIHIFTVQEIPYFTGFSSRQARCFLVQSWVPWPAWSGPPGGCHQHRAGGLRSCL